MGLFIQFSCTYISIIIILITFLYIMFVLIIISSVSHNILHRYREFSTNRNPSSPRTICCSPAFARVWRRICQPVQWLFQLTWLPYIYSQSKLCMENNCAGWNACDCDHYSALFGLVVSIYLILNSLVTIFKNIYRYDKTDFCTHTSIVHLLLSFAIHVTFL